ncbi:MAG: GNAT family N-acetyltransferase [Bacteroidales bacterium]|jgi:GNAT superfamily N-acetyltransferase
MTFEPLTINNWDKFEQLFGAKGACGSCWCMYYRLKKSDFVKGKSDDGNKMAIQQIVRDNKPAGVLGFHEGRPIAWCAFAPREDFMKLERSRVHKRIDDNAVWSLPCFFIDKAFRRQGVSVEMLKGVIAYAKTQGIKIIEAYPTIPAKKNTPDAFLWTGLYKSFERVGFQIVDRTSPNKPMVRYYL